MMPSFDVYQPGAAIRQEGTEVYIPCGWLERSMGAIPEPVPGYVTRLGFDFTVTKARVCGSATNIVGVVLAGTPETQRTPLVRRPIEVGYTPEQVAHNIGVRREESRMLRLITGVKQVIPHN